MTKLFTLAALSILLHTGVARAGDSSWLLCKGVAEIGAKEKTKTHLVASLHEHRGTGGRDLSVTVIYGVHVNRGDILGKSIGKDEDVLGKTAPLKLVVVGKNVQTFKGTATLAQDLTTFTLAGSIDPTYGQAGKRAMEPVTAKLSCELLDDLAIK